MYENVLFYNLFSKQNIYVSGNLCELSYRWADIIEALLESCAVTKGVV